MIVVIIWITLLATLETHQYIFDGTLEECKKIAIEQENRDERIEAGCYQIDHHTNKKLETKL